MIRQLMNSAKRKTLLLYLFAIGFAPGSWLPTDSITSRNSTDQTCYNNARSVVPDPSGNIHVTWRGKAPDTFQVWYSFFDVRTQQWSNDTMISSGIYSVGEPAIACDSSGNIYVAWINNGLIRVKRRDAGSGEWLSADSLLINPYDSALAIAIDRFGVRHLTWTQLPISGSRICYVSHTDSGWGRVETVATTIDLLNSRPAIACSPDGELMISWHQRIMQLAVLCRRRMMGNWLPIETVYSRTRAVFPGSCWSNDSFFVAFVVGEEDEKAVLVRARGDDGWGDTVRVSEWRNEHYSPSIVADEVGNIHLGWVADRNPQVTNQICYRKRDAIGVWDTLQVLTSNNIKRERVSIAAGNGKVQIAWTEIISEVLGRSAVRMRRYERIRDVGVLRIDQPRDTLDSATVVMPVAWVKNWGDFGAESIRVVFRLGDSFRFSHIPNLEIGDSIRVVFDSFFVNSRGNMPIACSVWVRDDYNPNNNIIQENLFVRIRDVAVESVISPKGRVDDTLITPRIRVYNAGNVIARFSAVCSIFNITRQTLFHICSLSLQLGPQVRRDTAFLPCQVIPDSYLVRFRLKLAGDSNRGNDTASVFFRVITRDVGVSQIVSPVGVVDSGVIGQPVVLVRNFGDDIETIAVRFAIGTIYFDTILVCLAPAAVETVRFRPWVALNRGTHSVLCSTMLSRDKNPANDKMVDSVFVRVKDAGVVEIIQPAELNSRGEIIPKVRVKNYGSSSIHLPVFFEIKGSGQKPLYLDRVQVDSLAPDADTVISFISWQAVSGRFTATCFTLLENDMVPDNDTLYRQFRVARKDVALSAIIAPGDTVIVGGMIPSVVATNLGEERISCYCYCGIFSLPGMEICYLDSASISLDAGETNNISFNEWQATPGRYRVVFRTALADDEEPANDTLSRLVYVESLSYRRWQDLAPIPAGQRNKKVKAGGSLVSTSNGIYALKGGGSNEWYFYDPGRGLWSARANLPLGANARRVKGGAALTWDGGDKIYALKGGNSREFWCYDLTADSWTELPRLPDYTRGVRFGSGLGYLPKPDTGKIFCLKGSGTDDFLVYWIRQQEWHARRPVPRDNRDRPVKRGSALTVLGERIFVLKGGTNEFYEYLPGRDTWIVRSFLPLGFRLKKCHTGATLTSDGNRFIYAFKGGRSTEFWRYDAVLDSWEELAPIPPGRNWRRVGAGGALTFFAGKIYAFKGGGSREFWCYDPNSTASFLRAQSGADTGMVKVSDVNRRLGVIQEEKITACFPQPDILVFDITGRRRNEPVLGSGVYFIIKCDQVAPGKVRKILVLKGRFRPGR